MPVRPDGRISMPLIPDILAAGKTPAQLGDELAEKLKEYVQDPIVTVMVTGFDLQAAKLLVEQASEKLGISHSLRPEDIKPDPQGHFTGEVTLVEPLGVETILHIRSGEQTLLSLIAGMTPLKLHDNVRFSILRDRLHFFDMEGQRIPT